PAATPHPRPRATLDHRRLPYVTICPLLLPGHVHHGDLPSFPTRRSSDLALVARAWLSATVIGPDPARIRPDHRRQGRPVRPAVGDRKSTRLNSSHVKISYAVFCLKKKREDARGSDQGRRGGRRPSRRRPG